MNDKISIRFFNDREVRAAWDDANSQWLFSIVDVIGILSESKNPRNYWKVMKHRLAKDGNELVTKCNQLKMAAADGKRYLTDCLSQADMLSLIDATPSRNAMAFAKWLITGEDQLDSKSRDKAYELWDSSLMSTIEVGTVRGLQQIHSYLFGGIYEFAGKIRTKNIDKGGFQFAMVQYLPASLSTIERMAETTFDEIMDKYVEMNVAHPFMEGNGRSARIWLDMMLKRSLQLCVDWSKVGKTEYMEAMVASVADSSSIKNLIRPALTDHINDREMFMKGIDYSYYYEEE